MHRSSRRTSILAAVALLLVACGGNQTAGTDAPTTGASPTHDMTSHAATDAATPDPASPEATEPADSGEPEVLTPGLSFTPGELTVSAGTTVRFTNPGEFPHTVTHGSDGRAAADAQFDDPLAPGASITITFDEPGTYEVTCKIHPEMNMRIVVEG